MSNTMHVVLYFASGVVSAVVVAVFMGVLENRALTVEIAAAMLLAACFGYIGLGVMAFFAAIVGIAWLGERYGSYELVSWRLKKDD